MKLPQNTDGAKSHALETPEAVALALAIPRLYALLGQVCEHIFMPAGMSLAAFQAANVAERVLANEQHFGGFVPSDVNHLELMDVLSELRVSSCAAFSLHSDMMQEVTA